MRKFYIIGAILLLSLLIFPRLVQADGDICQTQTPQFKSYLTYAAAYNYLALLVIISVVNYALIIIAFRITSIKIIIRKLMFLSPLVSLISFLAYWFWYLAIFLNISTAGFHGHQSLLTTQSTLVQGLLVPGNIGPWSIILVFIFNPMTVFGFVISFLVNWFLLRKFWRIQTEGKKTALILAVITFPLLGVLIGLLISEIYMRTFPFTGQTYLPCK